MADRDQQQRKESPGEIHPSVLYRIDEVKSRMRWSDSALRSARLQGLKVHRYGKRAYVFGDDLIDYIRSRPEG